MVEFVGSQIPLETFSRTSIIRIMTMEELKQGIHDLGREDLQKLATWVTLVKRSKEPGRGQEIAAKLDSKDNQWVPLEELDRQLPD